MLIAIRFGIAAVIVAVAMLGYWLIARMLGIEVPAWAWYFYALISLQMTYDRLDRNRA